MNWAAVRNDHTGHLHVKRGASMWLNHLSSHCGTLGMEILNALWSNTQSYLFQRIYVHFYSPPFIRYRCCAGLIRARNGGEQPKKNLSHRSVTSCPKHANKPLKSVGDKSGHCFQARHKCFFQYDDDLLLSPPVGNHNTSGPFGTSSGQPANCFILHKMCFFIGSREALQVQVPPAKDTACCFLIHDQNHNDT